MLNLPYSKDRKMNLKQDIEFYDINFWFGENYLSEKYTLNEKNIIEVLLKRKETSNIGFTLLSNFLSYFYNPKIGNDQTSKLISMDEFKKAGAFGALFMEQDFFYNPDSFENWLQKNYENGFRILRIFPKTHKYPFEISMFNPFYEVLNSFNFPVMISIDELDITGNKNIEWDKIADIADVYDNMPIIIDGGQSKELMFNCFILSLLNNTSNVYFETHNLLGFNQIEDLANFKGSRRLIFGSNHPVFDGNMGVSRILNSSLGIKDKSRIASLNIKNIIENIII
ncbi:MAG: amidohydrolase family protein [Candidatus Humimicrobiaceae bacterium]